MMTIEEIRVKLGLKPWGEHILEIWGGVIQSQTLTTEQKIKTVLEMRRTGRTTKMICEGLALVSEGKPVCFTGWDLARSSALKIQARYMAVTLDLDVNLIVHNLETHVVDFTDRR